jgi:ATP-binding cassette subfamily F protein 3
MLQLKNVSIGHGSLLLLKDINLDVFAKNVIGIIGDNGSGKSSLFASILENLELLDGEICKAKHLRIAHVDQNIPALSESALSFTISGNPTLHELITTLERAEHEQNYELMMRCHQSMHEINGYSESALATKILAGLGFSPDDLNAPVKSFSG